MTVYAIVDNLDGGYDHDKKHAAEAGLKLGDRFTVKNISMGQSHTSVHLNEHTGGFNSIYFTFEENGHPINIYRDDRFNPYI